MRALGAAAASGALAALLLALVVSAPVAQALVSRVHPEVLGFLRPHGLESAASAAAAAAAAATAGSARRRLLQEPPGGGGTFAQPESPFTFDGFGFGYGGVAPGGGLALFGFPPVGFGVNLYNVLFRDIFNDGLNSYLASALPNTVADPLDFLPPEVGRYLDRDVSTLIPYDADEAFIELFLRRAFARLGRNVDLGCVGPVTTLKVQGAQCEILADTDRSVECRPPSIRLTQTPLVCNLPYRSFAELKDNQWRLRVRFGRERTGELTGPADLYSFGAALNVTTPYIGYSTLTRRLANDVGVQQWYQFFSNLVLNELLRIQAALLSGAVDSRILTYQAQQQAAAAGKKRLLLAEATEAAADGGGGSGDERSKAVSALLGRVAERLGVPARDLIDGLRAAGALPAGVSIPTGPTIPNAAAAGAAAAAAAPSSSPIKLASLQNVAEGDPTLLAEQLSFGGGDGGGAPSSPSAATAGAQPQKARGGARRRRIGAKAALAAAPAVGNAASG